MRRRRAARAGLVRRTRLAVAGLVGAAGLAVLAAPCGPPSALPPPSSPSPTTAGPTPALDCYGGSIASVHYDAVIPLERVVAVWQRNGWRRSDPSFPATEQQVVGIVEGGFTDPRGGVIVTARRTRRDDRDGTSLEALVARSVGNLAKHPEQAKEAVAVLDRFRGPLEREFRLPPAQVAVRINGCSF